MTNHSIRYIDTYLSIILSLVHVLVYSPRLFPRKRSDSYLTSGTFTYAVLQAPQETAY